MAKANQTKKTNPLFWVGLVAIGVIAFVMTGGEPTKSPATRKSRTPINRTAAAELYTKEDREATFQPVNEPLRNAFKPLVVRSTASAPTAPGGIPSALTGGDGNWVYSGMAVIDGKPTALIENHSTGEGVFVGVGEKWKRVSVRQITDEELIVVGEDGEVYSFEAGEQEGIRTGGSAQNALGFAPAQPTFSGPIGPMTVQPERAATDNRSNQGAN